MSNWPAQERSETTSFGGLSRSKLMTRIRSFHNGTTELRFRALLKAEKLTGWKRHYSLPGRPDFVFLDARVAVFIDGCFWHGHGCARNLSPKTNASAWRQKIHSNRRRDRRTTRALRASGWSVIRIWECALGQRPKASIERVRRIVQANA